MCLSLWEAPDPWLPNLGCCGDVVGTDLPKCRVLLGQIGGSARAYRPLMSAHSHAECPVLAKPPGLGTAARSSTCLQVSI